MSPGFSSGRRTTMIEKNYYNFNHVQQYNNGEIDSLIATTTTTTTTDCTTTYYNTFMLSFIVV